MAYIFAAYTLLMSGYVSSASINLILVCPLIKQRYHSILGFIWRLVLRYIVFLYFEYVLLVAYNGSILDAYVHGSCRPCVDFLVGVLFVTVGDPCFSILRTVSVLRKVQFDWAMGLVFSASVDPVTKGTVSNLTTL